MQVGCFDPAEQLEATESTQFVSLVETRGKWSGRLIHHPALKKEAGDSDTESSLEIGSRAAVTNASVDGEVLDQLSAVDRQSLKPTVLDDYHDPLLGDTDTHWIAVTAPLRVHSRRYGWLDNGWYLIVQDRRYEMPSSLKATESFRLY